MMPQKNTGKTKSKTIPAGRRMQNNPRPAERITVPGREFVQDVGALTTFGLTLFSVNPRNALLFPRLSAIASRYEKYRFTRLKFVYESQAVTTDAGTAFMYMDPDPYDVAAASKAVVMNHKNSARNHLYEDFSLNIDPMDLKGERFCRTLDEESGDLRQYDVGAFRIGALSSASKTVGELYVDYSVELISPTVDSYETLDAVEDAYTSDESGTTPTDTLNRALNLSKAVPASNYFVPIPEVASGEGGLSIQGVAEFLLELYAEGVAISALPNLGTDSPSGEKKTITPLYSLVDGTTKLYKSWLCYFNNPTSVVSLLQFLSLTASSIAAVTVFVRPYRSQFSAPTSGFALRRSRVPDVVSRHAQLSLLRNPPLLLTIRRPIPLVAAVEPATPNSVAAVEPATPVAKSREGTCVMLPDLSSPKVPVPAPSPPRKFVLACHRCGSFDDCGCPCTKLQQRVYTCDNCRHPTCLGQCS